MLLKEESEAKLYSSEKYRPYDNWYIRQHNQAVKILNENDLLELHKQREFMNEVEQIQISGNNTLKLGQIRDKKLLQKYYISTESSDLVIYNLITANEGE